MMLQLLLLLRRAWLSRTELRDDLSGGRDKPKPTEKETPIQHRCAPNPKLSRPKPDPRSRRNPNSRSHDDDPGIFLGAIFVLFLFFSFFFQIGENGFFFSSFLVTKFRKNINFSFKNTRFYPQLQAGS
jgi:hypothetical protein